MSAGLVSLLILVSVAFSSSNAASISLTYPGAGVTWYTGQTYTIKWTSSGIAASTNITIQLWRDISYYPDTLVAAVTTSAANTGSYVWTLPASVTKADNNYYIYVFQSNSSGVNSQGPDFNVQPVPVSLNITAPVGGATWYLNTTVPIKWSTANLGSSETLQIQLYMNMPDAPDPLITTICSACPNSGSISYLVPQNFTIASNYYVYFTSNDGGASFQGGNFVITTAFKSSGLDLVLGHLSDEVYSSYPMQQSYTYCYQGACSAWSQIITFTNTTTTAKMAIYQSNIYNYVAVVFKGTNSVTDAIADINIIPTNCVFNGIRCGTVHSGFMNYYTSVASTVKSTLNAQTSSYNLLISGHSLGAAMAMLSAVDLSTANLPNVRSITLTTFGQPGVGRSDYLNYFANLTVASSYTRYVNTYIGIYDWITQITYAAGYLQINNAFLLDAQVAQVPQNIVGYILHSMDLYVSSTQDISPAVRPCSNNCGSQNSNLKIWSYSVIPDASGCVVQSNAVVQIQIYSNNNDKYAVCLFTSSQYFMYSYGSSSTCGGSASSVVVPQTGSGKNLTLNITASGAYVVVIENHNMIEHAYMWYSLNFTKGYIAPSPPQNLTAQVGPAGNSSVSLSWLPPVSYGAPATIQNYVLYYGQVGGLWSSLVISGATSYTFFNLTLNTAFTYVVSASNGAEGGTSLPALYNYGNATAAANSQ